MPFLVSTEIHHVSSLTGIRKTNVYAFIEVSFKRDRKKNRRKESGPGILPFYCSKIKLICDTLILMAINIYFKY